MVFENLTLFEIQLDGAQFGPSSIGESDDHDDDTVEQSGEGGRPRLVPVFMLALLAVGAGMLYRRSRSTDIELDAESEDAEADLATAQ